MRENISEMKTALVTGASHGIGRAIARELAREGYYVVVNYCGSKEAAEAVLAEIEKDGGCGRVYQADVADAAACAAMFEAVLAERGRIEALVNNAGITRDNLLMRMSEADFDEVIRINLKGAFNCCKQAARPMIKARFGRIVNITSVVGLAGNAGQVNYAASKAGLIGLTKAVAKELAPRGITCNAVAPGFIKTRMTEALGEAAKEALLREIPLKALGEPADVAKTVVFLLSDAARYITGQTISVDGGMHM